MPPTDTQESAPQSGSAPQTAPPALTADEVREIAKQAAAEVLAEAHDGIVNAASEKVAEDLADDLKDFSEALSAKLAEVGVTTSDVVPFPDAPELTRTLDND